MEVRSYSREDFSYYCQALESYAGEEPIKINRQGRIDKEIPLWKAVDKLIKIWNSFEGDMNEESEALFRILKNPHIKSHEKIHTNLKHLISNRDKSKPIPIKFPAYYGDEGTRIFRDRSFEPSYCYTFPRYPEDSVNSIEDLLKALKISSVKKGKWQETIEYEIRQSSQAQALTIIILKEGEAKSFRLYLSNDHVELKQLLLNQAKKIIESDVLEKIPLSGITVEKILTIVCGNKEYTEDQEPIVSFHVEKAIQFKEFENALLDNFYLLKPLQFKTADGYEFLVRNSSQAGAITIIIQKGILKGSYRLSRENSNDVILTPLFFKGISSPYLEKTTLDQIDVEWIKEMAIKYVNQFADKKLTSTPLACKLSLDDIVHKISKRGSFVFRIRKSRTADAISLVIEQNQKMSYLLFINRDRVFLESRDYSCEVSIKQLTEKWIILNAIKNCPFTQEIIPNLTNVSSFMRVANPKSSADVANIYLWKILNLSRPVSLKVIKNIDCTLTPSEKGTIEVEITKKNYACFRLRVADGEVQVFPLLNEKLEGECLVRFPLDLANEDYIYDKVLQNIQFE